MHFSLKVPPAVKGSYVPYNTRLLGLTHIYFPNTLTIGSSVFAQLFLVSNTHEARMSPLPDGR